VPNNSELKPNQIWHIARKIIPDRKMHDIFGKTTRYIQMQAADPRCCEVTRRTQMEQMQQLIETLDDYGRRDVAQAALEYMAGNTGLVVRDDAPVCADKSVDGEIADLAVSMGQLGELIRTARADGRISTEELIRIKKAANRMKSECDQLLDAAGIRG